MPLSLAPEIAEAISVAGDGADQEKLPSRGDWQALKIFGQGLIDQLSAREAPDFDVKVERLSLTVDDGSVIEARLYTSKMTTSGAGVLYLHGGGLILGTLENYEAIITNYVAATGVSFLSVAYRLAPGSSGEVLAEDCFSGLRWLVKHALELRIDPNRIAVMGDSAGGGLAAAVAILARNRGLSICRQILLYPMLDDRTLAAVPHLEGLASWTYDFNYTAWTCLLGNRLGTANVSSVEAPARLKDFSGLPAAYIEVGDLDIFCKEDLAFAGQLMDAAIHVELHVHPGAPHAYDRVAPQTELARRIMLDRHRVLKSL